MQRKVKNREHLFCVDITHAKNVGKYGKGMPSTKNLENTYKLKQ